MDKDLSYLLKIGLVAGILTSLVFIIWTLFSSTITNYMIGLMVFPSVFISLLPHIYGKIDVSKNFLKIWFISALFSLLTMVISFGFILLTRSIKILNLQYIIISIIFAFLVPLILIKILKIGKS